MRRWEYLASLHQNGLTELPPLQLMKIWQVMDECIRTGVSTTERTLPGRLNLRRRAPMLYQRLMRGYVASPTVAFAADPPSVDFTQAFPQVRRGPLGQGPLLQPSMPQL